MSTNIEDTTAYGGKPYPVWKNTELELPGYRNAVFRFTNSKTNEVINCGFMISPSGFSEQRSNINQMNRTSAGWFVQRTGRNLINLALSGYMLDARNITERLLFIAKYNAYAEDNRNDKYEYVNDWIQTLYVEGIKYDGYIQSISFSKNAIQPLLYQYNLTFIAYKDTQIYHSENTNASVTSDVLDILGGSKNSKVTGISVSNYTSKITNGMYAILKRE